MLQISLIRKEPESIVRRLAIRGIDAAEDIKMILEKDEELRKCKTALDTLLSESNQLARQIGECFKSGDHARANELKERTAQIKSESKQLEELKETLETALEEHLIKLPNTPSMSVPAGKSSEDNLVVTQHGSDPALSSEALPHWELAKKYDLIDFELGVKITGAGFPVYKGKGARLQRALINFFLDQALEQGYKEIQPPVFVNEASGYGTGQLPDKEGQMYHMTVDNLYAIPTAEVPITNLYRDVILNERDLPVMNVGYTPCFRREAGSYGKDVRGLNRLHQFDKVEIVQIDHPDRSYETLEKMQNYVQKLLQMLGLKYRVLKLCGGDMGFTSALTYDMEVWSAGQQRWLEVSSVSNFETFQCNRLKLRFRNTEGKTELCHSLNGSALALPRIVAALLENNQTETGIRMPEVLHPYLGFEEIS